MNNFYPNLMGNSNLMNQPNNNYYMNINNLPHYNIIQVHGQNGADAFQMAPNSKVLLLDDHDAIVWFVQTDGAGYKTITPYSLTPYQQQPEVDLQSINMRLTALEEKINVKSNTGANKSRKSNANEQPNGSINSAT